MYLTASEYAELTGRDINEATDSRIALASRLFDRRIGYYARTDGTYKLTLSELGEYQSDAVKDWVAWQVATVVEIGTKLPDAMIKLGRFMVDNRQRDGNYTHAVLGNLILADLVLKDTGLINRVVDHTNEMYYDED